jgi:hypothetical protein
MKENAMVICEFCGTTSAMNKACIGFGIEKPISQSHYFCSEEHRSEFIISETARERGIGYEIRKYINKGRTKKHSEPMTIEDIQAMMEGELITCLNEKEERALVLFMDPFGDVKEY